MLMPNADDPKICKKFLTVFFCPVGCSFLDDLLFKISLLMIHSVDP